ncbi:MAG TPA: hypothetical protein VGN34_27700, partial [Ktedonobacteraceae bacterium]
MTEMAVVLLVLKVTNAPYPRPATVVLRCAVLSLTPALDALLAVTFACAAMAFFTAGTLGLPPLVVAVAAAVLSETVLLCQVPVLVNG